MSGVPRVLKGHTDAVERVLTPTLLAVGAAFLGYPELGAPVGEEDMHRLASDVAFGVLSAYDDTTRYVVIVREPDDAGLTVFGPYATAAAAEKALNEGHAFALRQQGALARIYPLTPSPRATRTKKSKQETGSNA